MLEGWAMNDHALRAFAEEQHRLLEEVRRAFEPARQAAQAMEGKLQAEQAFSNYLRDLDRVAEQYAEQFNHEVAKLQSDLAAIMKSTR